MSFRILSESPIQIIDAIKRAVDHEEYDVGFALLMLDVGSMIKNMSSYSDDAVKKITMTDFKATIKACTSQRDKSTDKQSKSAIEGFKRENKTKILNDLTMIEKRLLKIYTGAGVDVHRDY